MSITGERIPGPFKSEDFWSRAEGDPFKKGNDIAEQERLRDIRNAEENRGLHREVLRSLQGDQASKVPARCKQPSKCPLAQSCSFGSSIPSSCYWQCGVTNENRNETV